MGVFQVFSGLAHRNCLIFGTKVKLDNTYTLEILKLVGKFLIPLIPLNPLKRLKNEGFPTFLQIGSLELSDFYN